MFQPMFAIERLDVRLEMGFWSWFKKAVSSVANVVSRVVSIGSTIYSGIQGATHIFGFFF